MGKTVDIFIDDATACQCFERLFTGRVKKNSTSGSPSYRFSLIGKIPRSKHYQANEKQTLFRAKFKKTSEILELPSIYFLTHDNLNEGLGIIAGCLLIIRFLQQAPSKRTKVIIPFTKLLLRTDHFPVHIAGLLEVIDIETKVYDSWRKAHLTVCRRLANDELIEDLPVLCQELGDPAARKLARWFGVNAQYRPKRWAPDKALQEINQHYVVVSFSGKTLIVEDARYAGDPPARLITTSPADLKLRYRDRPLLLAEGCSPKLVDAATFWLGHKDRRHHQGMRFEPYPGRYVYDYDPSLPYNLFTGFPRDYDHDAVADRFLERVKTIICLNDELADRYLHRWIFQAVTSPTMPNPVVLLLRGFGGQEAFFIQQLHYLFGVYFVELDSPQQVSNPAHLPLERALVVYFARGAWEQPDNAQRLLYDLMTETQSAVHLAGKIIGYVASYKRIILSVDEGWTIPDGLPLDRFFILDAPKEESPDRSSSYLFDHRRADPPSADLSVLRDYPQKVEVLSPPPMTRGTIEKYMAALDPIIQWWYEVLTTTCLALPDGNVTPFEQVLPTGTFYDAYKAWCAKNHRKPQAANKFKPEFVKLTKAEKPRPSAPSGTKKRPPRPYLLPSLYDCLLNFAEWVKVPPDRLWAQGLPRQRPAACSPNASDPG